jgi:HSP20 family protein
MEWRHVILFSRRHSSLFARREVEIMAENKKQNPRSAPNGNARGNGGGALTHTQPRSRAMAQFGPLGRLRSEFDQLFDDFFRGWSGPNWGADRGWMPSVNVAERDDAVVVRADAPGFESGDFDLQIQGDQLVLCACQSEESSRDEGEFWEKRELYQTVPLPAGIDAEHIDAQYRNGVLTVTLPKTEQSKGRKIDVKS